MDPPQFPPPPTSAAAVEASRPHSLPPLPFSKLRLLCSYGGHIVPRPQTKSLCYAGGETRIVAVDRRTTASTISSLTHHLSRTLYGNRPFMLKYQLPNEDLDSLISITTDEDLENMLEEHDRIASSPTPSRIRLFLFPTRPESVGSLLLDPKSDVWFSDALKSSMIINRGLSDGSGMVNGLMGLDCLEGNGDGGLTNSGEGKCGGGDSGSVPESMVLETCSSFGSTNSSVSMSNLPSIGVHSEDPGSSLVEKKVKVAKPSSIESENSSGSAVPYQKAVIHQGPVQGPTTLGSNASYNTHDSESIIYNPSSTVQLQRPIQLPNYLIPHNQIPNQKQQPLQYIHPAPPHYMQYPPISSYYPMYVPHQPSHQQPHQQYPIYMMPVGPSPLHPPLHTHVANTRVAMEAYGTGLPSNDVHSHQNQEQDVGSAVSQPMGPTSTFENNYENDLAYAQIYKSQPFPPPKYETITKAAALQIGTSQQQ